MWGPNEAGIPAPVGAWVMNEGGGDKIFDLSGNGNIGTFNGTPDWVPKGVELVNGQTEYISLPDISGLFSTEATVNMFVKANSSSPAEDQTGIGNFGTHSNNSHYPYIDGSIYLGFLRDDRLTVGNVGVDTSEWHLLTVTNKPGANGWKFYQNATEYYSATGENTIFMPTIPIIGRGISTTINGYYFDGKIGWVSLYNQALTPAQIQFLYTNPYYAWDYLNDDYIPIISTIVVGGQIYTLSMKQSKHFHKSQKPNLSGLIILAIVKNAKHFHKSSKIAIGVTFGLVIKSAKHIQSSLTIGLQLLIDLAVKKAKHFHKSIKVNIQGLFNIAVKSTKHIQASSKFILTGIWGLAVKSAKHFHKAKKAAVTIVGAAVAVAVGVVFRTASKAFNFFTKDSAHDFQTKQEDSNFDTKND